MSDKPLHRFAQPIQTPGRRLLHHIPLKFVSSKVAGGGRKSVDTNIPLVPFIDCTICMIAFLILTAAWTHLAHINATGKVPGLELGPSAPPPEGARRRLALRG